MHARPTFAGFLEFVRQGMGIPASVLPDDSIWLVYAYGVAREVVLRAIERVAPLSYTLAVYNLGGDNLINYAQDVPPSTYFADLRDRWDITSFVAGVVASASDEGTGVGIATPDALKQLTLGDLQNLKTPWGRAYLAIAQKYGTLWGLTQ